MIIVCIIVIIILIIIIILQQRELNYSYDDNLEYRRYVHKALDYTKEYIDKIPTYHTTMSDELKEHLDEVYSQLVDIKEDI